MSELRDEPVACHRCGHAYAQHQPACRGAGGGCGCAAFRWVDPAPEPGPLGYRHPPLPV